MTELIDRLTGRKVRDLPPRVLAGQLLVTGGSRIDGERTTDDRVLLMDGGEDTTAVETIHGSQTTTILQGPRTTTLESVSETADQMEWWLSEGLTWWEVVIDVAPVASREQVGEHLEPTPLETTIQGYLPELYEVFARPTTELRLHRRRLPVSRARRISRHATQVLATHSEDWLQVKASGVVPLVVESLIREEIIDIYENRVAARLLDAIVRHLTRTLARIDDADDLLNHELVGWWRQKDRISELWGSLRDDDQLQKLTVRRRLHLVELLGRVRRLERDPLYKGVPTQARAPMPIRVTNLLADDPDYRAVRIVWTEWWRSRGGDETPAQRRARQRHHAAAFARFCSLVVARSINSLTSTNTGAGDRGGTAEHHYVRTPWGLVDLVQIGGTSDGTWELRIDSALGTNQQLRIVALPAEMLTGDAASIAKRLRLLHQGLGDGGALLVMYPGTGRHLRQLPSDDLALAHHTPLDGGSSPSWVVPVSPLDLESQERVGRAVRWHLFETLFRGYPLVANFPSAHRRLLAEERDWLVAGPAVNTIRVLAPVPSARLTAIARRIENEAQHLEHRLAGRGKLDAERLRKGIRDISNALEATRALAICPVCGRPGTFEARQADTFHCSCRKCAEWGLWHDPRTDDRIPYLFPSAPGPDERDRGDSRVDFDRWYGRDLLARPCLHPDVPWFGGLVNPWTGYCTEASSRDPRRCSRCAASHMYTPLI